MRTHLLKLLGAEIKPSQQLAELLALNSNREDLLGVKPADLPSQEKIISDTSRLAKYSHSSDYQVFVKEAWARVLTSLDVILDDKATEDKVKFHRGVVKATLDLMRLSYQARAVKEQLEKDRAENATSPR